MIRVFKLKLWGLLLSSFVFTAGGLSPVLASQDVTVIANHKGGSLNLSKAELERIYKMRQKVWHNKEPIKVFVLPADNDLHQFFVEQYLGMTTNDLNRHWSRLVFTGRGVIPTEVANQEEMLERVSKTPGAIGYISKDKANATNVSEVKVGR